MSVEDGRHRICQKCEGSGMETFQTSDPNCENCQYGDCDYGHEAKTMCYRCDGTWRVEVIHADHHDSRH